MNFNFTTELDVSHDINAFLLKEEKYVLSEFYSFKGKINYDMQINATSWGINSIWVNVPNQEIKLNNDQVELFSLKDDQKSEIISVQILIEDILVSNEIDLIRLNQDIRPKSLSLSITSLKIENNVMKIVANGDLYW